MMKKVSGVVEKPYLALICVILVTGFMAYGVTKLTVTTDFKEFLSQEVPSVRTTLELENKFGSVSSEMILVEANDVSSASVIKDIAGIENAILSDPRLENYPLLVSSYLTYVAQYVPNYSSLPDDLLEATVKGLLDNLFANPQTSGTISKYITSDRKTALIQIYTNTQLSRSELLDKTAIMGDIVDNFGAAHPEVTLLVGGSYSSYNDINSLMGRDNRVLIPVAMVFVVLILFLTFKRLSDILICFSIISLASLWAIGAIGHLGMKFTMVHVALVPLLLGMGVDYSIYMLNRYYEERSKGLKTKRALKVAIFTIGAAIFACMITTVIGFASFSISDITPIQTMGIMAAFGIFSAFILSVTLLPSLVMVRDRNKNAKVKAMVVMRGRRVDKALSIAAIGAERHRRVILLIVAGIVAASAVSALGVSTSMSFKTFLPSDIESAMAQDEIENKFGGSEYVFVLANGDMLRPATLQKMYEFENAVLSSENNNDNTPVTGSLSLADLVLASAGGRILSSLSDFEVAAIVDALRTSQTTQMQMRILLTDDNAGAAIIFYTNTTTDIEAKQATDLIRANVLLFSDNNLDMTTDGSAAVGGQSVIIADILGGILSGMIDTTIIALILCLIVLILIFRSTAMGAVAIIPVTLVVLWELGTLMLLGWSLDVLTMGISALVIGAGIDYSVQIMYRFREEWKFHGKKPEDAIRATLMNSGMSVLAAMGTTVGVFVVLTLSRMPAMSRFGSLTALVVTYALVAALFVLPSLIVVYAARKKRK